MTTLNERLTAKTKQGGIFRRRNGKKYSGKTNGTDLFLGCICTHYGETTSIDLDLCGYAETPAGVLMEFADDANNLSYDAASPIGNNKNVNYCDPVKGDEFLGCLAAGLGCTIDHLAVLSASAPGFLESFNADEESIAQIPPFRIMGKWMETVSAVSGKARYAWIQSMG